MLRLAASDTGLHGACLMLIAFAGRQQKLRKRSQLCLWKPDMEGPEREAAGSNAANIAQLPELALDLIFRALDVRCCTCALLWLYMCRKHLEDRAAWFLI